MVGEGMRGQQRVVPAGREMVPPVILAQAVPASEIILDQLTPLIRATVRRQLAVLPTSACIDEEGIVQDAWFNCIRVVERKPELFTSGNNFSGYVCALARNSAIDAIRRVSRQDRLIDRYLPEETAYCTPDANARDALEWVEVEVVLEQLINALWQRNKDLARTGVLLMANDFDLPLATIAQDLNVSIATASRLRAQALAYFRRALATYWYHS
jgi:RNA polymerase sigma factor (sigma-70 family)